MKKMLLITVVGLILLTSGFVVSSVSFSATGPKIAIPVETWDFGKVKEGIAIKHSLIIKNSGKAELTVNAYPSCHACTTVTLSSNQIPAGSDVKLGVTFYSTGKSGKTESVIMIQSNDPDEPVKKITIKGTVVKNDYAYTTLPEVPHDGKARIVLFYSQTCKECINIKDNFLPKIRQKYLHNIEIKLLEITEIDNFKTLLLLEKNLGHEINKTPPLIFIGNDVLEGESVIEAKLDKTIVKAISSGGCGWPELPKAPEKSDESLITNKFQGLTVAAVIGGGLIDGVNPCAFTTIIFLISYLSMLGKKGKELILTGAVFTTGVFITYFLIGVGLLEVFIRIPFIRVLGGLLSWAMAVLLGVLCILSLYDYYLIRKGKVKEVKLQLNNFLKQRIHAVIRKKAKSNTYLLASFVMGLLVALIEFPCTGQVYFPIVYVLKDIGAFRALAFSYLLIYNLMFVLPLIGVFALVYYGTTSGELAKIMQKHNGTVKLLTAFLFAGLTVMILFLH